MNQTGARDERAHLVASEEVAEGFFWTRLKAPGISAQAWPGQFVELRVGETFSPLLRLPLSLGNADPQAGTIELLYERRGLKSQALSQMPPGKEIACLGPLGRGFQLPPPGTRAVLVGGGIGVSPLLFWGKALRARGFRVVLLVGARSVGKHLPDSLLEAGADQVRRATDDGSWGHAGPVTELLVEELKDRANGAIYACGPRAMMAAVVALGRERQIPCQVSLEEYMACGIGICGGCVVEMVREREGISPYEWYRRVCVDGPVFDAYRVHWGADD